MKEFVMIFTYLLGSPSSPSPRFPNSVSIIHLLQLTVVYSDRCGINSSKQSRSHRRIPMVRM